MAVPKRKTSVGRRDKRRSHLALVAPNLYPCPNCGARILSHTVCPTCGQYKGVVQLAVKQAAQPEQE